MKFGRRLHLIPPEEFIKCDPSNEPLDSQPVRGLTPGTLVRIRSREEIARTLDANNKNKGLSVRSSEHPVSLWLRFVPIKGKVERIIDERTGKIIQMKK